MIWFDCRSCGKTHGRPESQVGALVFCPCGQGNQVPWESTAAEPQAAPATVLPTAPNLAPVTFDAGRPAPAVAGERPRPRRGERRDSNFCFNHQRVPQTANCADCKESFCPECTVEFQGTKLCGPCKNFRARRAEVPPLHSSFGTASLIVGLLASALAVAVLCLSHGHTSRMIGVVALAAEGVALALGIWALRLAQRDRVFGIGRAVVGLATAGVSAVVIALLEVCAARGII